MLCIFMLLLSTADPLFKISFRNITRVTNGLDLDLGPNCLQKFSADNKILLLAGKELISYLKMHNKKGVNTFEFWSLG